MWFGLDAEKPLWQCCGTIAQPRATTKLLMDVLHSPHVDSETEQLIKQSVQDIRAAAVDYHTVG